MVLCYGHWLSTRPFLGIALSCRAFYVTMLNPPTVELRNQYSTKHAESILTIVTSPTSGPNSSWTPAISPASELFQQVHVQLVDEAKREATIAIQENDLAVARTMHRAPLVSGCNGFDLSSGAVPSMTPKNRCSKIVAGGVGSTNGLSDIL